MENLLRLSAERAIRYLETLDERGVAPTPAALERLAELGGPLPEAPADPAEVIDLLDRIGSPAAMGGAGGRYSSFVTGGALPATLAANWLASTWDQNGFMVASSPLAAAIEENRPALAARRPGAAARVRRGLCHRRNDGQPQRARRCPAPDCSTSLAGMSRRRGSLARRRSP